METFYKHCSIHEDGLYKAEHKILNELNYFQNKIPITSSEFI